MNQPHFQKLKAIRHLLPCQLTFVSIAKSRKDTHHKQQRSEGKYVVWLVLLNQHKLFFHFPIQ